MGDVKREYIEYLDSQRGAERYNRYKKILYGRPDSLVVDLFRRIYPEFKKRKSVRILDVGGGDGKRLKMIIDLFRKKRIGASATLVEPSRAFTENLKKLLQGRKRYDIKVVRSKFEDYSEKGEYDLIFFIHSIYTFKNSDYLRKAKKMLAKDGLLVIMTNDADSFLAGLKRMTDKKFGSKRKDLISVLCDLKKHKFGFRIEKFDTKFKGIVKNGKITSRGKLILKWIALTPYGKIKEDVKLRVAKYYQEKSKGGINKDKEVLIKARIK